MNKSAVIDLSNTKWYKKSFASSRAMSAFLPTRRSDWPSSKSYASYYGISRSKMQSLQVWFLIFSALFVIFIGYAVELLTPYFNNYAVIALVGVLVALLISGMFWGPVLFESTLFKMGKIKRSYR